MSEGERTVDCEGVERKGNGHAGDVKEARRVFLLLTVCAGRFEG